MKTYTIENVANLYGTSIYNVKKAITEAKVKGQKINGVVVFTLEDVRIIESKIPGYKR